MLLLQGTKRFGPPIPEIKVTIESIRDREHLEQLSLRLLEVFSWTALIPSPPQAPSTEGET
jgi:hypothetical protein